MDEINLLSLRNIQQLEEIALKSKKAEEEAEEKEKNIIDELDFLEERINRAYEGLKFDRKNEDLEELEDEIIYVGSIDNIFDINSNNVDELSIAQVLKEKKSDLALEYRISIDLKNRYCSLSLDLPIIKISSEFFTYLQLQLIFERMKMLNTAIQEIHNAVRNYANHNNLNYTDHPDIDYKDPNQIGLEIKN